MLKVSVPSPGCGTEYKLSWTKGIAITSPGSRVGLCSSSALKLPEAPLRWKRRGVKLYFPGSDSTHHIIFCLILKFKVREEGNVLGGEKVERRWREGCFYLAACSRRPSCPSAPVRSRSPQAPSPPPPPAPSHGCSGSDPTLTDTW